MGRPTLHDPDALLDAAVAIVARDGVRALTVSAVAREAGAPSGSLYNRFPDRASLLAAVWMRTVHRFQQAYLEFVTDDPPVERAVEGAPWTVRWCRDNLAQAAVLEAGPQSFEEHHWPDPVRARWAALRAEQNEKIGALARLVADRSGCTPEEAAFAMFDLPLAVVRPYLQAGRRPPERAGDLARRLAGRIIHGR